jgi:hypothetical protein
MTAADRQGSLPLPSDSGGLPEGDENGEVHADELGDDDGAADPYGEGVNSKARLVKPTKRKAAGKAKVGGKPKTKQPTTKTKRRVHA